MNEGQRRTCVECGGVLVREPDGDAETSCVACQRLVYTGRLGYAEFSEYRYRRVEAIWTCAGCSAPHCSNYASGSGR
jgi:hypothetical protein